MKIRIGIVGSGDIFSIAHFHTQALKQIGDVEIVGIYNRNLERSKKFIEEHELFCAVAFDSFERMLENIDAVLVCTPSNAHTQFVIKAIEMGKDIFCEKPIAVKLSECEQILTALKSSKVKNMVGFDHRYSENAKFVKKFVKDNFGKIYNLSMTYGAQRIANESIPFEWRMDKEIAGFGATQDFGSHMLDLMRFMTGIELDEISCLTSTSIKRRCTNEGGEKEVENDDSAVISAVGKNGEMCSFVMSRIGLDPVTLMISGDAGLLKTNFTENKVTYWRKTVLGGYTGEKEEFFLQNQKYFNDFFLPQMQDFCKLVKCENVNVCSFEEACETQKLLHFAEQSAEEKCVKKII